MIPRVFLPMFTINELHSPFRTIFRLQNSNTEEYADILPECGGILNALYLQMPQGLYNVIDGFASDADFIANNSSSFKSNILCPFPNRIQKGTYTFENKQYTLPINFESEQNAIHGLVYDKTFTVTQSYSNNTHAALHIEYSYTGDIIGFPFPFVIAIEYTLSNKGLQLHTRITNTGTSPFPLGFGWHHYFRVTDSITHTALAVPTTLMYDVDSAMIPTGQTQPYTAFTELQQIENKHLDTCFAVEQNKPIHIVLKDTVTKHSLTIEYHSTDFPFVQIYTPPHRSSIAIEPMTCAPNAFNNKLGLIIAQPSTSYNYTCNIYK